MMIYNTEALELMSTFLVPWGFKVDAIITDPPYGITRNEWDTPIPFAPMWHDFNQLIKSKGAIVVFGNEPFSSALRLSNPKNYKYDWYWQKENGTGFLNSKKMPLKCIENICVFQESINYNPQMRIGFKPYATKQGKPTECYGKQSCTVSESNGDRYPLNILKFKRDKLKLHPTQKPVALMEYLIQTYTKEGDTVLDPFMGSGTTGVACKNLGREFVGVEMNKGYFDIASDRLNIPQVNA